MTRIAMSNTNQIIRSCVTTALLVVAFACAACLFAVPDAHASGESRTWLSNYNLPMEGGVPTLSGDYILSEDIHGKTFRIKGDTNIDLNGHVIDGDDEEEIGFNVDEGKTLAFINSGEDAYIRDYEEHCVVLDDESKLNMKEACEFGNVIITGCGEGAVLMDGDKSKVSGGIISGNHIKGSWSRYTKGAGIYVDGDNCEASNITIKGNYAHTSPSSILFGTKSYGGGIYVSGDHFKITDFIIKDNHATHGGGVYVDGEDATFVSGSFIENSAYVGDVHGNGVDGYYGGAGYANDKLTAFYGVDFTDNSAARDGGALYLDSKSNALDNCRLIGNKAVNNGGAIYDDEPGTQVRVSELIANTASKGDGGAIYFTSGGYCHLSDSTLKENLAGRNGGGIFINSGTYLKANNANIEFNDCADDGLGAGVCTMGGIWLYRDMHIRGNGGIKNDGSLAGGKTFSNLYVKNESFVDYMTDKTEIWIDTNASRRENYPRTIYEPNGEASALDFLHREDYMRLEDYRSDRVDTEFFENEWSLAARHKDREDYLKDLLKSYGLDKKARTDLKDGDEYTAKVFPKVSTPMVLRTTHQMDVLNPVIQYRTVTEEGGEKLYGEWQTLDTENRESGANDGFEGVYRKATEGLGVNHEKVTYQVNVICLQNYDMPNDSENLPDLEMKTPDNIKEITVDLRDGITKKKVVAKTITRSGDEDPERPTDRKYKNVVLSDSVDREDNYDFAFVKEYAAKGYRITGVKVYYDEEEAPADALVSYDAESMTGTVRMPNDLDTSVVYLEPEIERIEYNITIKYDPSDLKDSDVISEASINAFMSEPHYYGRRFELPDILKPGAGVWTIDTVEANVIVPEGEKLSPEEMLAKRLWELINGIEPEEQTQPEKQVQDWISGRANHFTILEPYNDTIELTYNLSKDDSKIAVSFLSEYGIENVTWNKGDTLDDHRDYFDTKYKLLNYCVQCHKDENGQWTYDENKDIVPTDQKLRSGMVLHRVMMNASCVIPCDENGRYFDENSGSTLVYGEGDEDGSDWKAFLDGEPVEIRYTGDKVVEKWYVRQTIHKSGSSFLGYNTRYEYWITDEERDLAGVSCTFKDNALCFKLSKDIVEPAAKKVSTLQIKPVLKDPVTNITGVPDTMEAGGTWDPSEAMVWPESVRAKSNIEWTVQGPSGVEDVEGEFTPESPGTYKLEARVKDGLGLGTDYTQEFTIEVEGAPQYIVRFDPNGGEMDSQSTVLVTEGNSLETPNAPTRDGYSFDGWYKTANQQEDQLYDLNTPVIHDINLKAHWLCQVTASVQGDGGSVRVADTAVREDLYKEGSKITIAATPDEGKRVARWIDNGVEVEGNKSAVYTIDDLKEAHEVKVVFEMDPESPANKHHVYAYQTGQDRPFYSTLPDVTVTGEGEYAPGQAVTLTATPDPGYSVHGWARQNGMELSHSNTYTFIMGESDVDLNVIVYPTVTDLTLKSTDPICVGQSFTPEIEGFTSEEEDDLDDIDGQYRYIVDPLSYPAGTRVEYHSQYIPTVTPTKTGNIVFRVIMATYGEDGSIPQVTRFVKDFTIKVDPAPCTVTFRDGESTVATRKVNIGNTVGSIGSLTKSCSRFEGWFNGDTKYDFDQPVTTDLILTAEWTEGTHVAATASCTQDGMIEHYEIGSGDDTQYYTDAYMTKEVTADKLQRKAEGHIIDEPEYSWSDSNQTVMATGTCSICNNELSVTVDTTSIVNKPATCTEMGETIYTAEFSGEYSCFGSQTKTEETPALGHSLSNPVYEWNENHTEVTASSQCQREGCEHKEVETVAATSEETKAPTCTERGETTYTSGEFKNDMFAVQTKTLNNVAALDHNWGEWSDVKTDEETGKRYKERVCSRCEEIQRLDIAVDTCTHESRTTIPRIEPTCTEVGYESYEQCNECGAFIALIDDEETIVNEENLDTIISKLTIDIDPDAHDWDDWTQTQAPTCSKEGIRARVCKRDNSHIEKETVGVDPDAHSWGTPEYVWDADCSNVTATRICSLNPKHKQTETVGTDSQETKAPTCTEQGETTYTSKAFGNEAFSVQTKKVIEKSPLGHDWGEVTYQWSDDNSKVTAKRCCGRDGCSAEEAETALTTFEVIEAPTAEKEGLMRYAATFENQAFGTATKDVPISNETEKAAKAKSKADLTTAVNAAKDLKASAYTSASWKKYIDAVVNAQQVLAKNGATKAEYDAAINAVNAARKALVTRDSLVKAGETYKVTGSSYKVLKKAGKAAGTVAFVKAKKAKTVTVPARVKLADGKYYNVTKIGKKAFAKTKTKTVVVKTKKLTKKSVKGSLKGSKVKTIKVKVGKKKINKKYVKKYKKIFTKKNAGKKVKVK